MSIDISALSEAVLWAVTFVGAFLAALWLSLVIWTFRDMRARSRDLLAQVMAALVVAVEHWVRGEGRAPLARYLNRAFDRLRPLDEGSSHEHC